MGTSFEPIPEIDVTYCVAPQPETGDMVFESLEQEAPYQNLKLTLYNHPKGKQLAEEYEVVLDPETLLVPDAIFDIFTAWRLACWRDPVLRKFFEAAGLCVYEKEVAQ